MSVTRFVRNEAPTVEVVEEFGTKLWSTKRCTREVFPTPCPPKITILASMLLLEEEAIMMLRDVACDVWSGGVVVFDAS